MKDTAYFKIKRLPPSVNEAVRYTSRGGYPTKKLREWLDYTDSLKPKNIKSTKFYGVEIIFHMKMHYKNGNLRTWDALNYQKYLIDAMLPNKKWEGLLLSDSEIDDKQLTESHISKVDCGDSEPYTEVTFYCIS